MTGSSDDLEKKLEQLIEEQSGTLIAIAPEEAINEYLDHKETDIRSQTISEYGNKLAHFRAFCEKQGIDNLNDLNGRNIKNYQKYRRNKTADQDEPLSAKTMRDDSYLLRDFIRFLENIEAVKSGLSEKIKVPTLDKNEGVRDIRISDERVEKILDHLDQFKYAQRPHVVWVFFSETGRRLGCLYAIDLRDCHLEESDPYIELHHRENETELKNGEDGEAELALSEYACQVFKDYIENHRIDVTTENGRDPFLTSKYGRLSKSTIRKYIYQYSRPCEIDGTCPHGRDIESCDATESGDAASKCPSSRPPYALRHGYITSKLQDEIPIPIISGRCDASPEVIKKHYDERDESDKRELRQQFFQQMQDDNGGGYL